MEKYDCRFACGHSSWSWIFIFKASKSNAIVTEPLDKDGIERTVKKEELMAKASEYYEKYKEQIDVEVPLIILTAQQAIRQMK